MPQASIKRRAITLSEASVHERIADYLRLQYPHVLFRTDGGGVRLSMGAAIKYRRLQSSRAFPDLHVIEPRGPYAGLFLELKREGERVWLKDGSLTTDKHVREQYEMLLALGGRGYRADFAIGFDAAKKAIDSYLAL